MNTAYTGLTGEHAAREYLKSKGYIIVTQNYKTNFGEIDIIARDGKTVVFVEVKSRNATSFGDPIEAITRSKARTIIRCATQYMTANRLVSCDARFDIITILRDNITHIENAFDANV